MKNIIIITGHAHYATGLLSSLEMIAGKNDDIIAVDFTDGVDVSKIYADLINKYKQDNVLFVCDLLGGTPFKEASKLTYNLTNAEVVIGCNLGSLLEISLIKDSLNLTNLVSLIITSSQKNIIHLIKDSLKNKPEENSDGI